MIFIFSGCGTGADLAKRMVPSGKTYMVNSMRAPFWLGYKPAKVPLVAIQYGLVEFGCITTEYKYLKSLTLDVQNALSKDGYVAVYYVNGTDARCIMIAYHPKKQHLLFGDLTGDIILSSWKPLSGAIDLKTMNSVSEE